MITEDYVSYEVAKLLKDKGFDQNCATFYLDGQVWRHHHVEVIPKGKQIYAAPTQAMTMKWLREVHKILILVEYDCPMFSSDIYKMDDIDEYGSAKHIPPTFANCKNYEEACKAAIKYCLENLI